MLKSHFFYSKCFLIWKDFVSLHHQINQIKKTNIMKNQELKNTELVGKFVSMVLFSDVRIVGKIVGTFGQSGILVQKMNATKDIVKKEWIVGGFAGNCTNNVNQKWEFEMLEGVEKMRLSKQFYKWNTITNQPYHFYDYNF